MTENELISRIIYRDALMLVLDKPFGLPVHPGPKGGITLTDHLHYLRFGLPKQPQLAHRLDKDTSGCLVLGRHAKALSRLGRLFHENHVEKTYIAVVDGLPDTEEGEIDIPLASRSPTRGWWMKADPCGQPAQTYWRVLGRKDGFTTLELKPKTGRTHQLRVHCAESGWPIVGDTIYGKAERFSPLRLHLHAYSILLPLYPKKEPLFIAANIPEDMKELLTLPPGFNLYPASSMDKNL